MSRAQTHQVVLAQIHSPLTMQLVTPNYEGVRTASSKTPASWVGVCSRMSLHDPIMPLNIESDKDGGCRIIAKKLRAFLLRFDKLDISKL